MFFIAFLHSVRSQKPVTLQGAKCHAPMRHTRKRRRTEQRQREVPAGMDIWPEHLAPVALEEVEEQPEADPAAEEIHMDDLTEPECLWKLSSALGVVLDGRPLQNELQKARLL